MLIDLENLIDDYGELRISKKQLMSHFSHRDYQEFSSKIKKAQEYRSLKQVDRKLEVVYINGTSGSGKTVLAKYLADKLHYDYFVSGSGDDILDGYDKEECIILDDFRAGSMRFMEVLKFLDNNTNSSVKSRYYNKDISNTKIIFITSVIAPQDLYSMFKTDAGVDEPAKQFYRRLNNMYYKIDSDGQINAIDIDTNDYLGYSLGNINDIFKELNINPDKPTENSLLSQFFTQTGKAGHAGGKYSRESTGEDVF